MIEGIVSIILISTLSSFIGMFMNEMCDAWGFFCNQKSMALSSRAALNRIVRELKRVDQNTNIITHTSQEVTFRDVDGEMVTFMQSGDLLLRNSEVLMDGLETPTGVIFSYLDEDGDPTAITNQMRLVRCRLIARQGPNKFVVESASRIRVKRIK